MNITELRAESLKIANQAKALLDTINDTNEADVQAQFDRMMEDSDKFADRAAGLEKIEARNREFDAADDRRPLEDRTASVTTDEFTAETRAAAIEQYLRGKIDPRELRAQSVGTDAEGGYLVPTDLQARLIEVMKAFGPMNEGGPITYYVTNSGNPVLLPVLDDTAGTAAALAENTAAADADLTFGQKSLGAYKLSSGVFKVSGELLADSALPVAEIVNKAIGTRLGRKVNAWLTTGTGTSQPSGIVTGAGAGKTAAAVNAIAADEIQDLINSVDPAYRGNAAFMFHDNIRAILRKLKDADNQYVWQPGMQVGDPERLFGYRYFINQDMASSLVANAKTVLFGDLSGYTARKAGPIVVRRLNERYGESDQVGFVGFCRVDGVVTDATAIKVLKQAAS